MYFLRLAKIKPSVEQVASAAWQGTVIGGEEVRKVERVLDVRQGELCWVAGTVYMDMPLKPNILEDVSKDVSQPLSSLSPFFSYLFPPSFLRRSLQSQESSHGLILRRSAGSPPLFLLSRHTFHRTARIRPCWKTNPDGSASSGIFCTRSPS